MSKTTQEINGTIKRIFPPIERTNIKKREFVAEIEQDGIKPQKILFATFNDRCDELNSVSAGDKVHILFNIKGKVNFRDASRVFNTLEVWKIRKRS